MGSRWFDGRIMYVATGSPEEIQFLPVTGRDRFTYVLTPTPGQDGWFTLKDEKITSPLSQGTIASLSEDGGQLTLVFYKDGRVDKLFEKTDMSFEAIISERWFPTIIGKYRCDTPDGRSFEVVIDRDVIVVGGDTTEFHAVTSNGYPLDVLDIEKGPAEGAWHFVRTLDGFNIYRSRLNAHGEYEELYDEVDDHPYVLTWSDGTKSRWSYLSDVFIIPIHFRKSSLRLIRNHILASHGYVFRDKELQKYFKEQPWYHPGKDNDAIELNFIEQMNISRIQGEEAKPDEERTRVSEEDPGVKLR